MNSSRLHQVLFWFLIVSTISTRPLLGQDKTPPYRDPSLPIEQRAMDIVSWMTLEEKVLQMQHTAPAIPRLGIPAYDWWNEALHAVCKVGYNARRGKPAPAFGGVFNGSCCFAADSSEKEETLRAIQLGAG